MSLRVEKIFREKLFSEEFFMCPIMKRFLPIIEAIEVDKDITTEELFADYNGKNLK